MVYINYTHTQTHTHTHRYIYIYIHTLIHGSLVKDLCYKVLNLSFIDGSWSCWSAGVQFAASHVWTRFFAAKLEPSIIDQSGSEGRRDFRNFEHDGDMPPRRYLQYTRPDSKPQSSMPGTVLLQCSWSSTLAPESLNLAVNPEIAGDLCCSVRFCSFRSGADLWAPDLRWQLEVVPMRKKKLKDYC